VVIIFKEVGNFGNDVVLVHCFITVSSHTVLVSGNKIINSIVARIPSATTCVHWHALLGHLWLCLMSAFEIAVHFACLHPVFIKLGLGVLWN
jgi:hypothetical protein